MLLPEDGFYKLSPGFVVERHGPEPDDAHLYLAMPADRMNPRVRSDWETMVVDDTPDRIDDALIGTDDAGDQGGGVPPFLPSADELIARNAQ